MSSAGQFVGAVVGGAIGLFFGTPILGAQLGMMVGGYIDPPPGPHSEGPRLSDLTAQTSTYGAGKTRAYGTVAVTGNVFWLEGDKYVEHAHEQESGGKGGGGGATQTTYTYSGTFAVALTEGQEITGIRRLWVGDRLIYDAGSDNVESILASNLGAGQNWKLYTGADDQEAEPRMQADKGAANVSNYPGRAYLVFYDLDLTEHYSNSLLAAQVKAEIVVAGTPTADYVTLDDCADSDSNRMATAVVAPGGVRYLLVHHDGSDNVIGASIWEYALEQYQQKVTDIAISLASGYGYTAPQFYPCHQCLPDDIRAYAIIGSYLGGPNRSNLVEISAAGYTVGDQVTDGVWKYGDNYLFASRGATAYAASYDSAQALLLFSSANLAGNSSVNVKVSGLGYSDNYVFAVDAVASSASACVIQIFDSGLAFVDTLTLSFDGRYALIQVVGDDAFYIKTGSAIHYYNAGTVRLLNALAPTSVTPTHSWFAFFGDTPVYGVSVAQSLAPLPHAVSVSHEVVPSEVAKLRDIVTAECGLAALSAADLDLTGLTNSDVRGYRVTGVSSPRAALEPLQAAWPFDVYQTGYKVGFKSRGGSSVATIDEADLGAAAGNESPILLPVAREMETQIARTVTVKHLDKDRDYEIGEQTAPERPGVSSVEPRQVELPIVLTADEAAQVADVLNAKEWTERVRFGPFSLPPTYANLEPTDVVTINHRNRAWTARLTRVEYLPDGRLTCEAVLTASAAYDSSASGSSPLVLGQSLVPLLGSSRVILLDIPRLDALQDNPGLTAVMYGFTANWPGGALVRSDDQGQTWQTLQGFESKANVFTVAETGATPTAYAIDAATVLTLTPAHDSATVYSITEAQLYTPQNIAAWGVDGRWEIVAFKTVIDNSGTYTAKDFLRGLYGTEWAASQHAAGDYLVMLDTATARFIGLPTTAIGVERLWRGVTQGFPVSTAADIADTYEANNLLPLAPVDLNGSRSQTTDDWTLTWQRRTRWPVELLSGSDVPLGEASESYEIEIYDATFTALKRTLTATTNSVAYTSAQQIADHGSVQQTLYVKVRQVSAVVGGGRWLQQSITRVGPADPYAAFVTSLLHFNGSNGSTTIIDVKGNAWACSGNAQLSTTAPLYGSASALFDGNNDSIYSTSAAGFAYGTGDYCIDIAFKLAATGSVQTLCDYRPASTNGAYPCLYVNASNQIEYYVNTGVRITGTTTLTSGTLYRARVARVSGITRIFINGTQEGSSWTDSSNMLVGGTTRPVLGASAYSAGGYINGRLDEFRSTKGAGRSAANYTVESDEFPDP